MKMTNRVICLLLIFVMIFSLVACNAKDNGNNNEGENSGNGTEIDNSQSSTDSSDNKQENTDSSDKNESNGSGDSDEELLADTTVANVDMESSTDAFTLLDKAYSAEEKFVYTATVSFEKGVASGLAFGAEDGSHFWVFNVDREANLVKLLYFTVEDGKTKAVWIKKDEDEDLGITFENELMSEYRSCRNKCIFCFIDHRNG